MAFPNKEHTSLLNSKSECTSSPKISLESTFLLQRTQIDEKKSSFYKDVSFTSFKFVDHCLRLLLFLLYGLEQRGTGRLGLSWPKSYPEWVTRPECTTIIWGVKRITLRLEHFLTSVYDLKLHMELFQNASDWSLPLGILIQLSRNRSDYI